jgi:AraC-like DNA-binding protein
VAFHRNTSAAAASPHTGLGRYVPAHPLSRYVDFLWAFDGFAPGHARERLLPTGSADLILKLGATNGHHLPVLVGPSSTFSHLQTSAPMSVLGVHFKPGGVFPFLGVPAGEVRDLTLSLDALWGARAAELQERLLGEATLGAKFLVLEQALLPAARLATSHPAVPFALSRWSQRPTEAVVELAEAAGVSQRHFIDRFRNEVGLSPKRFCRVRRFQQVIELVHEQQAVDWADVAAACGYFDQSHLTHEFRELSGFTPAVYFSLKTEHRNHVRLPD